MANLNSFTETTRDLVKQVNISLESMVKINESLTTEKDTVVISVETTNPITGDPSTYTFSIPSYQFVLNKLNTISNTIDVFVRGEGLVVLNDGTYREVKTNPLAIAPNPLIDINAPTKFNIKSNWFFEDLLFPQTYIEIDLKNKIDDKSDRIKTKRIIFDNFDSTETSWFKTNFVGKSFTYQDILRILLQNNKNYWEDEQIINLPLYKTTYEGEFIIINSNLVEGSIYYYLDTINYGINTDGSTLKNIELKVNDELRLNDTTLFKIRTLDVTEKKVTFIPKIGLSTPRIGDSLHFYSAPFDKKNAEIAVGYDECNILFIKGINDNYNLVSNDWGKSISFWTNDLILVNSTTNYENYYLRNIVDFGKKLEGEAKDNFIPSFFGVIPTAPTITADQFIVKQVNVQINAALDTEAIKTTQTQIESIKSQINSLKDTIAQQKAELVELTDPAARKDIQAKIDNNINGLSKKTIEYQSLVKSLSTIAYENDAVINNPKYRVRGFFEIPAAKVLTDDPDEIPQEIIGFDIGYRYLRLDGTGNPLNTYSYIDPNTEQEISGTFTDWEIISTPIKKKLYDSSLGKYIWQNEFIQDGQEVNINQVNISINKGEKVEIKIRSISEAGWPNNPLKSIWSNSIIKDFPPNLIGSNQILNILADAQAEEIAITLDETLNAAGVTAHLLDSIPNPNTGEGTYFKHQSEFIGYNYASDKNEATGIATSESTIDLQSYLDTLPNKQYITITDPSGGTTKTILLQILLQDILTKEVFDNL